MQPSINLITIFDILMNSLSLIYGRNVKVEQSKLYQM